MGTLQKTIEDLAKHYGKPVVFKGSELPPAIKVPTDIPAFDYVSCGGIIVNQNNEFYGAFSSLKSYMCAVAMGKFQKFDWGNNVPNAIGKIIYKNQKTRSKSEDLAGLEFTEIDKIIPRRGYKPKNKMVAKRVAIVDMEGTYTREVGEKLGVDNEGLLYYTASSMNEAIDVISVLLQDEEICLVVLDSMSIIGSDQENDKSMEEDQMATNARLWNKAARKLRSAMNVSKFATLISINATSTAMSAYGDPETVKNGNGWKLFKSQSIRFNALKLEKGELNGQKDVTLGRNISLMNKKQKFGTPYRESSFYVSFVDDGVLGVLDTDIVSQLVELGAKFNLIERSGSVYTYGSIKVNGLDKFKFTLSESTELQKLKTEVYNLF